MIKNVFKQLKNNFYYIGKNATIATSAAIALFQILGFLCDFNDIFPDDWNFFNRLLISVIFVTFIWIIMFGIKSICVLRKEKVMVLDAENGYHVYVEYGDIFEDNETERIIIITANRCFDTIVDNDLISDGTIHGMVVKKLCERGVDVEYLNAQLQTDLQERSRIKPEKELKRSDKRKGNLKRYPVGSISEFRQLTSDKRVYAFLGMSAFNADLHPETTDMEYIQSLQSVIEYCNSRSNKMPIYMPIIGTHGRDNKKSERELLQFMIDMLRFNKHLINTDIHIVVYYGRKNDVSIFGL